MQESDYFAATVGSAVSFRRSGGPDCWTGVALRAAINQALLEDWGPKIAMAAAATVGGLEGGPAATGELD